MKTCSAIWPPVLENLALAIGDTDTLTLAISPFIKADALEALLDRFTAQAAPTHVIVRWKIEDLLAGASDLKIFDVLEEREIPLYRHPKIHLKLFQFTSGQAYTGSSNITNNGLSLQESHNEEMGVVNPLDLNSFYQIRRLCDESRRITKLDVEAFQKAIDESEIHPPKIGEVILPPAEKKQYLVSHLPASNTLNEFLEAVLNYRQNGQHCPRMMHDIVTLNLTEKDLGSENIRDLVIKAFTEQRFIKSIVQDIRSRRSTNFGAVTSFVHHSAQDVPLPYRSKIKEAIARLYPWLESCFEDISYSIPGARSQVITSKLFIGEENNQRFSRPKKHHRPRS